MNVFKVIKYVTTGCAQNVLRGSINNQNRWDKTSKREKKTFKNSDKTVICKLA